MTQTRQDTCYAEALHLLERLVATPHTSRNEAAAADIVEEYLHTKDIPCQRMGNNVVAMQPEQASRQTLLLCAHLDTVKAVAGWQRDPLCPTLEGDRLYGLGSNDDGASLVCLLTVFCALYHEDLPYRLVLAATAEEEVSGHGGMEMVWPRLPRVDVALVGEPTGMQPAVAEKGLMVVDVTVHGRSGHAARNEGDNALYHALEAIEWIRRYHFAEVSPTLGEVKMTVTMIEAGTAHNVIPDTCSFTIDIRSTDCYSNPFILDTITQGLQALRPTTEVRARSTRLGSSGIAVDHPLVDKVVAWGRTPFGSPTLSDQCLIPVPSFKMGPGESSRSHTADEFVCLGELHSAIGDYLTLLTTADGGF